MAKVKVVYNSTSPTALKLKGSVINHVTPKVIFFSLWSLCIFLIDKYVFPKLLRIEASLISLLGLVISLLLVFRTNTAYDRYWEGRRLWSELSMAVRSISRIIWIHIDEKDGRYNHEVKRRAINLLVAYAYSCMHHLRGEYGVHHDDFCDYISHVPDIAQFNFCDSDIETETISDGSIIAPRSVNGECFHLPIRITHQISCFIADAHSNNAVSVPVTTILIGNINTLVSSLTGFERILTTPIPAAYAVHLSQTIWLFCLFLPFQVLNMMKEYQWVMIIVVSVAAFTMFGIVNIGEEIENPFGLDANDLTLNEYCTLLRKEIEAIIRHPPPCVEDWVLYKQKYKEDTEIHPPTPAHHSLTIHH